MTSWTPELDTLIWGLASTQSPADFAPSLELSAAEIRMRLLHLACERVNSGQVALEEAAHVLRVRPESLARICGTNAVPTAASATADTTASATASVTADTTASATASVTADITNSIDAAIDAAVDSDAVSGADSGAANANRGKPWTAEQDARALAAVQAGQPLAAIGRELGRTETAIRLHLLDLAARRLDAGAALEDAAAYARVSAEALTAHIAHKAERAGHKAPRAEQKAAAGRPPRRGQRGAAAERLVPELELTPDQAAALAAVQAGGSILLTGPAGTGKSFTVGAIERWARGAGRVLAKTATTGTAALQIGGKTLHSWLGIGRGDTAAGPEAATKAWQAFASRAAVSRVQAAQLLIVDEVSMLDAAFLDAASGYLSAVRGDRAPFGGLQLVLVGDFCQLPPVRGAFAFTGAAWARLAPRTCLLTTVRRQPAADFQEMLMRLRLARGLDADFDRLEECRDTEFMHGVEPTRLCARNAAADKINQEALADLLAAGAVPLEFETKTGGGGTGASWAASLGIPGATVACIGAQVMVTRNITSSTTGALVAANGTRGVVESVVVGADGAQTGVVLRQASGARCTIPYTRVVDEGNTRHSASFMPLQLAWAISIHKSQGATLDALEVDLGASIFEAGQAYVALSRARDLSCVRVTGLSRTAFRCSPAVLEFYTRGAPAP